MIAGIAGLGGTLLPERYIDAQLLQDAAAVGLPPVPNRLTRRLSSWWANVENTCGPASALRTLFDCIAMPLCAMLGFSANEAMFVGPFCHVRLLTPRRTPLVLLLTPWSVKPSSRWADLARHAHAAGAAWGFVLAPPFLSLVPTRGHATRHSLDIAFPAALREDRVTRTLALLQAGAFDATTAPGAVTSESAIERILRLAQHFQDGVRADLQHGVETSLRLLHPAIVAATSSRRRISTAFGQPQTGTFDEALTVVYRILFLLFAESRHLVPDRHPIYRKAYAVSRFCRDAVLGHAPGLWEGLAATSRLSRLGCQTGDFRVEPFNGALFARSSAPALENRRCGRPTREETRRSDEAIRQALVALASRQGHAGLEMINYRDLGVEQLGAVYERVLDLERADLMGDRAGARRRRHQGHSRLRKQTGTFYTPQPLAELVVRRTLAPLAEGATSDAILALRVVDPAMGSGAFLVAACRYLANAYEDALIAEGRLSPTDLDDDARAELRRIVADKCLAGVDRNPTAVRLARLSLWLTSLARGKPLTFLDHRLRIGDSLVGAWPLDLTRLSTLGRRSRTDLPLLEGAEFDAAMRVAARPLHSLLARRDNTVNDVRAREADWRRFQSPSPPLHRWRAAAHLWCARWFLSAAPDAAETRALLDAILRGDRTLPPEHVDRRIEEATSAAVAHPFFHWPLEFPDIFYEADGLLRTAPGYDAVIGNPPWEMVRRDNGIDPSNFGATLRYVRQSGQYPSCTTGHLNLYQAFVDRALALTRPGGRIGLVLPWGLATDDGAAGLRRRLLQDTSLDTVVGIDNRRGLFPIHRGMRFMAVTATTNRPACQIRARFGIQVATDLDALPGKGGGSAFPVTLSPDQLRVISGPCVRFPDARRAGDIPLLLALKRRFPGLGDRNGWGASFGRELNATDARPHLSERGVPVVEGKCLSPFTVSTVKTRRLPSSRLASMIEPDRIARPRLGYRDVSAPGNRFALIAAVIPAGVVTTHTVLCLKERFELRQQHFLCALFNSYVLNVVVRLLMGGHVTTTLAENLPAPTWRGDAFDLRIAELANLLRRDPVDATAAAELQGLIARRYELTLDELDYVLEGFPYVTAGERAAIVGHFQTAG